MNIPGTQSSHHFLVSQSLKFPHFQGFSSTMSPPQPQAPEGLAEAFCTAPSPNTELSPCTWRTFADTSSNESWQLSVGAGASHPAGTGAADRMSCPASLARARKPVHCCLMLSLTLLQHTVALPGVELMSFFIPVVTVSSRAENVSSNYSVYLHVSLLLLTGSRTSLITWGS